VVRPPPGSAGASVAGPCPDSFAGHHAIPPGFRSAAVAVILLDANGAIAVPLTRRAKDLAAHSGEVCLPGGTCDPEDGSAVVTARRECDEELGIAPASMTPVGTLAAELTPTGFFITPVVFTMESPPHYRPNPDEVTAVIEVPLAIFADPSRAVSCGDQVIGDRRFPLRVYEHNGHRITGATARIVEHVAAAAYRPK